MADAAGIELAKAARSARKKRRPWVRIGNAFLADSEALPSAAAILYILEKTRWRSRSELRIPVPSAVGGRIDVTRIENAVELLAEIKLD